ncbi:hypothetical protein J7K28_08995 [Candidatus Aerophobetes bacterium]|nr:hypothetical protein [Candidatus Aerophobetes bacterium]
MIKKTIKLTLNGKNYRIVLRKEKGVRKDYLSVLLPKTLEARVSKKVIEIIPVEDNNEKAN